MTVADATLDRHYCVEHDSTCPDFAAATFGKPLCWRYIATQLPEDLPEPCVTVPATVTIAADD